MADQRGDVPPRKAVGEPYRVRDQDFPPQKALR